MENKSVTTPYEIQNIPVSDSPNNDAFEAIVETYYQTQGYITSAGKWFWVWEKGRQQRGYQDIDILAVNDSETIIVSVTSNLDDKVNAPRGNVNQEKLKRLKSHFDRVYLYLKEVKQYSWMVSNKNTRNVVAYNHAFPRTLEIIKDSLIKEKIDTLSSETILTSLREHTRQPNLKIQNQLLRTIQLLGSQSP